MKTAEDQGVQLLEMIRFMTEQMGWNLEIEEAGTNPTTIIPSVKVPSDSLHLN